MGKAISVDGCQLAVVSPGTGDVEITSQPSDEIKINDKGVFFKEIKFSVSNSNGGGSVTNNDGTGQGSIIATGKFITLTATGDKVVLLDDVSASVPISGHSGSSSATGAVTVKVADAGQTDVIAL